MMVISSSGRALMNTHVCFNQQMADGLAMLEEMMIAIDRLQEKEEEVVARDVQKPSSESDSDFTSSSTQESPTLLRKLADAVGEMIR
jgi:hypothetical protein